MELGLLEIKSPQQQMEVGENGRRGRLRKGVSWGMVGGEGGHRKETEVAGSQSGSCTVNKISPQGA